MILYRLVMAMALPVMVAMTVLGPWPKGALRERLGLVARQPAAWWVHGASVGELTSAKAIIAGLAGEGAVFVTTNTATARAMVTEWGLPGVTVALAPFDAGGAAARLIAHIRPQSLIIIESELWPTRMAACRKAAVPVIVLGARMSDRSAQRWRFGKGLMQQMLAGVSYLSAQDSASEARLVRLGLDPARLGPRVNLKANVVPVVRLGIGPVPRAHCILAASTHAGEEALILDAFAAARADGMAAQLIIAPRHPDRGPEIARLIAAHGLSFAQRARGAEIAAGIDVYLADTLGEMDRWYAMAGVTVVGGSFAPKGGHTPFEPAAYGSAIVHGPSVHNFAEPFAALATAQGAVAVADGQALAAALCAMTPQTQARLAAAAQAALAGGVDVAALIAVIRQVAQQSAPG